MNTTHIRTAIETALRTSCGWDWTQDFRAADGSTVYADNRAGAEQIEDTEARAAALAYAAATEKMERECERLGEDALAALDRGDMPAVIGLINDACRAEARFGDCPVWGLVRDELKRIAA